ncbi:MAG: EAL domain-containing protein [Pseudobdellovibrionaceae bacterium]
MSDVFETVPADSILMKAGEKGDTAYLIEDGIVDILIQEPDGRMKSVGKRGKGAIIGEMALIDQAPRTATIKTVTQCKLRKITATDFNRRLNSADPTIQMVMRVIMARYRDLLAQHAYLDFDEDYRPAELIEKNYTDDNKGLETIRLEHDFAKALKEGQLSLHYQPIVNLTSWQVEGFEALMRWTHPEKGPISPGIFIPVAEDSGLIVEASKWALHEACSALKRLEGALGNSGALTMNINFTSRDFETESFMDMLYNTISTTDIRPQQIQLEITERLLMQHPDQARETLELCRQAGMRIAIDDFGTGYSSLSYLQHLPVDTLKIDQSFIRNLKTADPKKSSIEIVRAIQALSQNLHLKTVAEGIETQLEGEIMSELGCNSAQGYFFAKPMAEADLLPFLKEHIPGYVKEMPKRQAAAAN